MESIIYDTKLRPPACDHLVKRERLLTQVDSPDASRITVINADAGYGKTTLMTQMYDLAGNGVIWYQFDELDKDASVFMNHIAAAIYRVFPREGKALQSLFRGAASIDDIKDGWISRLANSFDGSNEKRLLVFLDDIHLVNNSPEIIELVKFMIAHLSDDCRFVIGSRKKPGISLGRLRAQRQVIDINTSDLTFTQEESRELFAEICPVPLSEEIVASWHVATEGWPIAMVMAAAVIDEKRSETDEVLSSLMLSSGSISEFLAEEIWKSMSENMKQMLMEASLLYEVDTTVFDMANVEREELIPANSFFQDAVERHLMTTCLVSNEKYHFHALFKQFLSEKLEATYSPAEMAELHGRYGSAYADAGENEQAIGHFFKSGQIAEASELLQAHGEAIFQSGKVDTVVQWLEMIPQDSKAQAPMLYLLDARVLEFQGDIEGGLKELAKARELLDKSSQKHEIYQCEFTRSSFLTAIEEYEKALVSTQAAIELAETDEESVNAINRAATLTMVLGDVDKAMGMWNGVVQQFDDETGKHARKVAIPQISGKFFKGDFRGVLNDTARFFQFDKPPELLHERFIVLFMRSNVLLKLCRYEQSLKALDMAGEFLGKEYGLYYRDALDIIRGHNYLYSGREVEGIRKISKHTRQRGVNKIYGYDSEYKYLGDYYRHRRDFNQAVKYHQQAVAEMENSRRLLGKANALFGLGASMLRLKGFGDREAHEYISKAGSKAKKAGYSYIQTGVHFYKAWDAMKHEKTALALEEIRKSLDNASRNWHNHFIAQDGRISMDLLALAYEHDIHRDYLLDIFSIIGPDASEGLSVLLESQDPQVRMSAVNAITAAGGVLAAPLIYRLLRDKDKQVKEAAKATMTRLREEISDLQEVLTDRENEVLTCVAEGISNAEIAERLYISEPTVKTHITRIFQKLGVTKRTQAAAFYHQRKAQAG